MNYYTIRPPEALSEYIRFFWVLECDAVSGEQYIHRSMADGCVELLFHYNGRFDEILGSTASEPSFISGIHGQSSKHRRFSIRQGFGMFGAYLYPYAIPALFGVSALETSDQMIDLYELLGLEGKNLEEQMMLAQSNEQRFRLLSAFLTCRLQNVNGRNHHLNRSIRTVIETRGQMNVRALAERHCLSTRQFERRFKELSGFRPKLYSRIVRFQSVFRELDAGKTHLTQVAQACGYYDQSHFIQEFKEFSGYNPKQFLLDNSSESNVWLD